MSGITNGEGKLSLSKIGALVLGIGLSALVVSEQQGVAPPGSAEAVGEAIQQTTEVLNTTVEKGAGLVALWGGILSLFGFRNALAKNGQGK